MVLLVLGVLFGLLSTNNATVHSYARVVETDPHLLLFIFLPVLIFESAFGMEVHTFMKTFMQVLLLAIPGLGKFTNLHSCVKFDFYLALKRSNAYKALFQLNQSMNPSLNVFINPLTPLTWYLTIHGPLSLL